MKIFENTDPNKVEIDKRVVLKVTQFAKELGRDRYYFLLKNESYLIWAIKSLYPSINGNPARWSGGTLLELPLNGLQWFINTLEQQFFKKSAEGGLPKDKFAYEELVDGERLCVSRMFGTPGYSFRNYSRNDCVITSYASPQQADFSDELLFEKGLFDQLKLVAEKLERGEL